MANPIVTLDAKLSLAGVDLSASCKRATVNLTGDTHDVTGMSAAGWKTHKPGAKGGTLDIELWQDYDAAKVDATLFANFNTQVAFETRADATTAIGAANPEYQGNCIISQMTAGGSFNSGEDLSLSFPIVGQPTRAVA